jgi:transcriptional regulator with XRE-family HTH domain
MRDVLHVDHIGARVAYWRKRRGLTQAVLAGLAGLSQPFLSQIESGRRNVERRATLIALARALQVTVADLLGQPGDPTDPLKAEVAAAEPAIRLALIEIEEGELHPVQREPAELDAAIAHMADLRARSDYAQMAPLLPSLLPDAAAAGHLPLVKVAYQTSACLRRFGYRDLALSAARIAVNAASEAEELAWLGAARFAHVLTLPIEAAASGTTGRVADRALAEMQRGATDPAVRQVLGQLHMSASLANAVSGHEDDAQAHLRAADQEAVTLGDPPNGLGFNNHAFGPTNVGLWKMAVAAEAGEYGRVVELSKQVNPGPLRVVDRHQSYWIDLGRALAHSGKTDQEAVVAFMRAERIAPVPFAVNPLVRDAISAMVHRNRRRSMPDNLRILARRVGVHIAA